MALDIKLVAAPGQIDGDAPRVRQQRKGRTGARRATVADRKHARHQAKAIALDRAAELAERKWNLGAGFPGMHRKVGQQRELGRDIGQRRGSRLGCLEDRLLTSGFDDVTHKGIEAGKR